MTNLNSQQFFKRIGYLLSRFKPNNETFEEVKQKEKIAITTGQINLGQAFKDTDLIILGEQEPGTIISVKGISREYIVRVNKGSADVWHNHNTNGLRGPLEGIVSFLEHGRHESYDLEEGVLRKTHGSGMPLFIYDMTKPREASALEPKGTWLDKYEHIYVWKRG